MTEIRSQDALHFIRTHRREDVRLLALQAHRYPPVDMPAAITQIFGWQIAKEKTPAWAENENILYPAYLSLGQCSSEMTARYRAEIIRHLLEARRQSSEENNTPEPAESLTDLVGGFGIDCAPLSSCFRKTVYMERQGALCEITRHNFPVLGLDHISICHEDNIRYLQETEPVDWIFMDPARRDGRGGKTVAISDYEPDVSVLEDLLLKKAPHVLVKLSPVLDLALVLHDLKHVQIAHIISVNNECKELLFVLGRETHLSSEEAPIHCINLMTSQTTRCLLLTRQQEREYSCPYTSTLKTYLHEPGASILKAGAFRSVSSIYNVEKLHPNSHLYTSDEYIPDFPGRRFLVTGSSSLNRRELKELLGTGKKANLTVRNFPANVVGLRKRLKLAEDGDTYLFATTLVNEKKMLIICQP